MFFERAFDLVHMITISIRHSSNYSILAGRRVTENYIWNAGNYFTDAELLHRLIPEFDDLPLPNAAHGLRQKEGRNKSFRWQLVTVRTWVPEL